MPNTDRLCSTGRTSRLAHQSSPLLILLFAALAFLLTSLTVRAEEGKIATSPAQRPSQAPLVATLPLESAWLAEELALFAVVPERDDINAPLVIRPPAPSTSAADLVLRHTVTPASASPGQFITYTLAFTNSGAALATRVRLTDVLPIALLGVRFAQRGASVVDSGTSPAYVWEVEDLSPGEYGVVTVTAQIAPHWQHPGVVTHSAVIRSRTPDLNPANNYAEAAVTVDCLGLALQVTAGGCNLPVQVLTLQATAVFTGQLPYTFLWQWGDGSSSTGSSDQRVLSAGHVYKRCGDYTVTLLVTSRSGCLLMAEQKVYINQPPVIQSWTLVQPNSCQDALQYEARVSDCDGLETLRWAIRFSTGGLLRGSGGTIAGSYTLPDSLYAGTIQATLVVTDASGCQVTRTSNLLDVNQPPSVLIITIMQVHECEDIVDYSAVVADVDGLAGLKWRLNFSDGGKITGVGSQVAGTYTLANPNFAGVINARLTITDVAGCSVVRTSNVVDINQPPKIASFILSQTACAGLTRYGATVSDPDGTNGLRWRLAFSDGGQISGAGNSINGNYTLSDPGFCGLLSAMLTLTDTHGCVVTRNAMQEVNRPPVWEMVSLDTGNPFDLALEYDLQASVCGSGLLTYTLTLQGPGVLQPTRVIVGDSGVPLQGEWPISSWGRYTLTVQALNRQECSVTQSDYTDAGPRASLAQARHWYQNVCPGWGQRYDIDLYNSSAVTLTGVVVRDLLPGDVRFADTTPPDGLSTGGEYRPDLHEVRWGVGDLGPGKWVRFHLHVYVQPGAPIGHDVMNRLVMESRQGTFPEMLDTFRVISCAATPTATITQAVTRTPTATTVASLTRTLTGTPPRTSSPTASATRSPTVTRTGSRTATFTGTPKAGTPTPPPSGTPDGDVIHLPAILCSP